MRAFSSVITLILLASTAFAQVGNDNPTGPSGQFNGNVTTGGSYDPLTGNATRAVTDMVVAGAVGNYPLVFSRVSNSRGSIQGHQFGRAGSWRHSYMWELISTEESTQANFQPTQYPVHYPDSGGVTFTHSSYDTHFRGPLGKGVRERFIPLNTTTMHAFLVLPDGGKVRFKATPYSYRIVWEDPPSTPPPNYIDSPPVGPDTYEAAPYEFAMEDGLILPPYGGGGRTYYGYTYHAEAIIDPHGLETLLNYNGDGSLHTIVEPGGRWLELVYGTSAWNSWEVLIDHIRSSDGRIVEYNYGNRAYAPGTVAYTVLDNVVYYPDPSELTPATAVYSYQAPNAGNINGLPLLSTASDPLYEGPMKDILYTYATGVNGDGTAVVNGQIRYEKHVNGTPVSNLSVTTQGRSETKGDGGVRTFTFNGGRIASVGDFVNWPRATTTYYDSNFGYVNQVIDRAGRTTHFTTNYFNGNVTSVTFPATPGDTPPGTPAGQVTFTYGGTACEDPNNQDAFNPYYLCSGKDEAGNVTKYFRYPNKRVQRIQYPDGAYETFDYNALGQVTYHRLKTGGTESWDYDPATNLVTSYRDPYHEPINKTGKPTAWYQHNSRGWLVGVTEWRGWWPGDLNHTTSYEYTLRGQVKKKTYPVDPVTGARYTEQSAYNLDGTVQSVTNERGHTTNYTYDDYKRTLSVTPPPAAQNDNTPRTTRFYYDRNGGTTMDYSHTDANVGNTTTPMGKVVKSFYDHNLQRKTVIVGNGSEAATTTYTYDFVGNLKTVKDPAGQVSGLVSEYFYDERNRVMAVNEPISTNRNNLGYTVSFIYDAGGRKKSEQRANNQVISYDAYDPMNRLKEQRVQRDTGVTDLTSMTYDLAGNLWKYTDGRQNVYTYGYDLLSRRTSLTYPPDSGGAVRSEQYHYDLANNMDTFTNRSGVVQTFLYDNRNREKSSSWSDGSLGRSLTYDPASNITLAQTTAGDKVERVYDWRDRKTHETQIAGIGVRWTVSYTYDWDSNRLTMFHPAGHYFTNYYNTRNQLQYVDDNLGHVVSYSYDLSGNRTTRTLRNGTVTTYTPDALHRPQAVVHTRGGASLGRFDYRYDSVNRVKSVKRDFSKGDAYGYYLDDQLKTAHFDAYNVDLDSPWGSANTTSLAYDANGNWTSKYTFFTAATYQVNNLNQYRYVNAAMPTYDTNGNLGTYDQSVYSHDAQNRLKWASVNGNYVPFWYDAFGRQILRGSNGQWIYSIWDGWDLIAEYNEQNVLLRSYVNGAAADEKVVRFNGGPSIWYQQDAQGSTTHLTDDSGNVVERYKYDPALAGAPSIYDGSGVVARTNSLYDNRFLYTGRDWMKDLGIYDYRNRFYLPALGRFLEPDPIGFAGDSNLYRYCGNNATNATDPSGLKVRLWGVGGNMGFRAVTSFSAQAGLSYGWRNPMTWTIGYNVSYVPGTSVTTFTGWGVSALGTVAGDANTIADLGQPGDVSYSSGAGGPPFLTAFPWYSLSADYGYAVNGSPDTFTVAHTLGTPSDKLGFNFFTASVTYASGELSFGTIASWIGGLFQSLFSNTPVDSGPPDNDPNRVIVYGTPIPTGSTFAGGRLGSAHFGGGIFQGVGPNGFGGHLGLGGAGGPFDYGTGGQGFGGVGNNSPGITFPPLKKPH